MVEVSLKFDEEPLTISVHMGRYKKAKTGMNTTKNPWWQLRFPFLRPMKWASLDSLLCAYDSARVGSFVDLLQFLKPYFRVKSG